MKKIVKIKNFVELQDLLILILLQASSLYLLIEGCLSVSPVLSASAKELGILFPDSSTIYLSIPFSRYSARLVRTSAATESAFTLAISC